jgi:hypothetical protein
MPRIATAKTFLIALGTRRRQIKPRIISLGQLGITHPGSTSTQRANATIGILHVLIKIFALIAIWTDGTGNRVRCLLCPSLDLINCAQRGVCKLLILGRADNCYLRNDQ